MLPIFFFFFATKLFWDKRIQKLCTTSKCTNLIVNIVNLMAIPIENHYLCFFVFVFFNQYFVSESSTICIFWAIFILKISPPRNPLLKLLFHFYYLVLKIGGGRRKDIQNMVHQTIAKCHPYPGHLLENIYLINKKKNTQTISIFFLILDDSITFYFKYYQTGLLKFLPFHVYMQHFKNKNSIQNSAYSWCNIPSD